MSSSAPQVQKSAARIMSMTIRVLAIKATSPLRRPKPLSMYWVKTPRKLSMTPIPPMALLALRGWPIGGRATGRTGRRRRRFREDVGRGRRRRPSGQPEKAAAVLRPSAQADVVVSAGLAEKLASLQFDPQGIVVGLCRRRRGKGRRTPIALSEVNRGCADRGHDERHGP